jgi:hypothetical protein
MRLIDRYLNELIDYGGEPHTRAEVILDMQQRGIDQPCIDRWLQGNEHAQRRRERRTRINTRLYLQSTSTN